MQAFLHRSGTVATEQLTSLFYTPMTADSPHQRLLLTPSNSSSPLHSSDEESGSSHSSHEETRILVSGTSNANEASSKANSAKALSSCILYCFCSVSMILVNKSLSTSYNGYLPPKTNVNIFLVVMQAVVAVASCELFKSMGWIEYPPINMATAKQWAPVNLFFCGMLFTGMASLQTNSVPMVTVFKNITNVMTTAGDFFLFGNKPEMLVGAAFGVMLLGAVAAAWNDISVTSTGLFWMLANCVCTSGYVLYMKFATQHVKLSKFGMVLINNILCTVFLLPVALVMGEVNLVADTPQLHTLDYAFKNLFAGFVGFFLNFASLNCVQATGPTTYAILGSMNKVPVAFLGYALFDSVIDSETWCYIAVSLCGGFLYSYAKIQSSRGKGSKN